MSEKLEIWGVKDPNISAQLALAVQLDLFQREAGLEVACRFAESGTTMARDVLEAEHKPFAFTQTPITAILLHEQGVNTTILAPLADIAGTQQVIIHEASGIVAPTDLEHKMVGMAKGAAVFIAIANMAKDCNVEIDNIYFINLLPHDQLRGFEDERLDALACWEPWTTKAQTMGGKFYFSGSRSAIPDLEGDVSWLINQSCLIAPDEHLEQAPDTLQTILRVLRDATALINHEPQTAVAALSQFFEIGEADLTKIMHQNTYSMTMDNLFRIGVLSFRDFLYETGRISQQFPEEQLYTPDLLQCVDPGLVVVGDRLAQGVNIIHKNGVYYREDSSFDGATSNLRFLLVDDSVVVRNVLNQVLDILGGEVVGEATTGNDALKLFEQLRPNFITMDLSMPGLSGVDAIKGIRQLDPAVNIIVISGLDLQEMREEVFDLGAKMYIPKPFEPQQAAAVIREILEQ